MKPLARSEYDDRDGPTWRSETYCELEWIRHEKRWNPWWTKLKYKKLFGSLPESWMETLTPLPASEALQKWVRCEINAWKRGLKKNGDAGATLIGSGAEAKNAGQRGGANGKVEGGDTSQDMAGRDGDEGYWPDYR